VKLAFPEELFFLNTYRLSGNYLGSEEKMGRLNAYLLAALCTSAAIGTPGCSLFGPYSSNPSFAAGEKPSYNVGQVTTADSGSCTDPAKCTILGKLILVPPSASMSIQIFRKDGTVVTCASPAEVAKALSSSGSGSLSVPTDAGKAAVALSASGAATEAMTLTQSTDAASHFVAAASFYNCLGVASGFIQPNDASRIQEKIFDDAVQIAAAPTKASDSTATTPSAFEIAGVILNLKGAGLVLTDNGGDDLSPDSGSQVFTFPTKIDKGKSYSIAVKASPAGESCKVTANPSGTVSGNVQNIVVQC
jgi:hypothetical protein